VLLLGGARSGKSALAVRLARESGRAVTFVATAMPSDDEMAARIARHRAERPPEWTTVEEPLELARAVREAAADETLVLDCLSLWVANLLEAGRSEEQIEDDGRAAAAATAVREATTVAVSNEVGLGIVPVSPLGRRYRDVLGRVNAEWASAADRTLLVVAGKALALAPAESLLHD
jgi:adenosyl cobinamide kinase/adenosyl cobinamide phosphate guanylyltransferase